MKSFFKKIFLIQVLLALFFISFGCQQGGSSGSGTPAPAPPKADENKPGTPKSDEKSANNNKPGQPINCENLWVDHVKNHPLGMLIQKQNKTSMIIRGQKTLSSASITTEKITFNNDFKVVTLYSTDTIYPMKTHSEFESIEEKNSFIELCKKNANNPPPPSKFDTVNMADETLTVKAGTFKCTHVKMTAKENTISNVDKMVIDTWMAKDRPGLIVKSSQSIIMKVQGNKSETLTETELILFKL